MATGNPVDLLMRKASLHHAQGDPAGAYQVLEELETRIKGTDNEMAWHYTIVYYKGLTALRMGENDNCVLCRGESSCIFPIAPRPCTPIPPARALAIEHFTEYLEQFPDDLEVRWLLNLAHMTLGEYPDKVDPRHRLGAGRLFQSEFDIGRFRDIGHLVGVNRFNQSGGAIMDDFDNDGLLDLVVTVVRPDAADGLLPQQGRRDIRGPHASGRPGRAVGRADIASRPITTTTATWTSSFRAAPGCPH